MNLHSAQPAPEPATGAALIESVIRADLIAALSTVLDADAAREPAGYRNTALTDLAAEVTRHLAEHADEDTLCAQQVLCLAEEAGEFVGAFRRWAGLARRTGTWAEMAAELADVVISAYTAADVLGIDLGAAITAKADVIMSRGWRDPRPAGRPTAADSDEIPDGQWACRKCGGAYFGRFGGDDGLCSQCQHPEPTGGAA
jgi:NTP pyrophosphatase (non-canonical NTP hydrolase)